MSLNTTAVRIKETVKDVKPEVMRRLVVPVTLRLDWLHLTLQEAFGWTNSHLFEFHVGEERWGIPDPDGDFGPQPIDDGGSAIVSDWSGLFGDRNTPQEVVRRHQDQYWPAMTDDAGDCVSRRQEPAAEQALVLSVGEEGQIQALDRRPA